MRRETGATVLALRILEAVIRGDEILVAYAVPGGQDPPRGPKVRKRRRKNAAPPADADVVDRVEINHRRILERLVRLRSKLDRGALLWSALDAR